MPRVLSLLVILFLMSVPLLIGEQGIAPSEEDRCQGKPPTSSCWMELSNQPGCYVWISYLIPDEARTWSGGCDGDLAQGPGYLKWFSGSGHMILESFGRFEQGKQHGNWFGFDSNENAHEGPFVEGRRHGNWVFRDTDGNVSGGPFVEDRQHGQWVEHLPGGSVHEGRRVHGKKHGRWVERWTDGRGVHEGRYVDSKRNGYWVEHWDDGSIQEGPYVYGHHHGRWVLRFPDGQIQEGSFFEGNDARPLDPSRRGRQPGGGHLQQRGASGLRFLAGHDPATP